MSTGSAAGTAPLGQRRWDSAEPEEKRALLKMVLRGKRLIIDPPEPGKRAHEADVTRRIRIE